MLGDTGVAVHPDDDRYAHLVGQTVRLPLVGRVIPIVADDAVDPEFGTGAVKVTPAHDLVDFEIAGRHGLEPVVVIDVAGVITEEGGDFAGLDRLEAREAVRTALEAQGLLVGVEQHHHAVGHCSRCGPWWSRCCRCSGSSRWTPWSGPAVEAVVSGDTRFVPDRWRNVYLQWMDNLRDWCISRQLWWGHRIPAWYCDACGKTIVSRTDVTSCPGCDGPVRADDDVLDTWFSSALWPFSTLGWPERTADLDRFYPTSALVTGFDIITFWVSRMLMMGMRFMGEKPFTDVVIHGLVRAADGRKMSKSAGNALDPIELAERYGADAVRLALVQSAAPGHDIPLNEDWIDAGRRFGNKLWNAVRFAVDHAEVRRVPATGGHPGSPGPEDRWILGRLGEVTATYDRQLDRYRFSEAVATLHNFAWSEVFDWYLEMAKGLLAGEGREATRATLGVVLRDILALLHPVMPYLTEELWSELGDGSLLATAPWPVSSAVEAEDGIDDLLGVVTELRRFRADHGLGGRVLEVTLSGPPVVDEAWWQAQLGSLGRVTVTGPVDPEAPGTARLDVGSRLGADPPCRRGRPGGGATQAGEGDRRARSPADRLGAHPGQPELPGTCAGGRGGQGGGEARRVRRHPDRAPSPARRARLSDGQAHLDQVRSGRLSRRSDRPWGQAGFGTDHGAARPDGRPPPPRPGDPRRRDQRQDHGGADDRRAPRAPRAHRRMVHLSAPGADRGAVRSGGRPARRSRLRRRRGRCRPVRRGLRGL